MARSRQTASTSGHSAGGRPKGSPGKRCYVIGDVHGRLDLLQQILSLIGKHNAERPVRDTVIVLLGDLIDRGPDSRGVIEFLRGYRPAGMKVYVISGNHEEMMLRAVEGDVSAFQTWITNGGGATAQSYGFMLSSLQGVAPEQMPKLFAQAVPGNHVSFLRSAADSIRFGDYLFAHAGVRPGVGLAEQTTNDLRWIRRSFLESDADHGFVVVHGHSVKTEIEERKNRIGIDTGAYRSGTLTAMWIEDDLRGFLQTLEGEPQIEPSEELLFE